MAKTKKKKSSVKKFSTHSRASGDSKQSVVGLCRRLDADLGAASGPSSAAASPCRARPAPMRSPASTARKSGRVSNSGERVDDQATRCAAARDLPPSGTPPCSTPPSIPVSSPVRLVLPSQSSEHLLHILEDVCISFDPTFGSLSTLLHIVRANELAQADIARAKGAASCVDASLVVAGGVEVAPERDQVPTAAPRRGAGKRVKSCIAPSRSSLRIKNLSHR